MTKVCKNAEYRPCTEKRVQKVECGSPNVCLQFTVREGVEKEEGELVKTKQNKQNKTEKQQKKRSLLFCTYQKSQGVFW